MYSGPSDTQVQHAESSTVVGLRTRNPECVDSKPPGGRLDCRQPEVKIYRERIVQDYTEGGVTCPSCGEEFARDMLVHGRPALKVIQGRVTMK